MTASTIRQERHQELVKILQRRQHYAQTLVELIQEQDSLIQSGEYASLLDFLARKQALIDALLGYSQLTPSLQDRWQTARGEMPEDMRLRCEDYLSRTEADLAFLLQEEERCSNDLQQQHHQTQQQLEQVSQGLALQGAYYENETGGTLDLNS